jgi:hypothetical protein
MPKNKTDEDDLVGIVYDNDYDQENDDNDIDDLSEDDRSKYYNNYNHNHDHDKLFDSNAIPITEYVILKIGIANLVISNQGKIRNLEDIYSSSMGFTLIGTPYRTFPVQVEKNKVEEYFVHDLIWRAFNGDPPQGWEVRHAYLETKRGNEFYNNALEFLELYPSTVTYMPSIRKYLPDPV